MEFDPQTALDSGVDEKIVHTLKARLESLNAHCQKFLLLEDVARKKEMEAGRLFEFILSRDLAVFITPGVVAPSFVSSLRYVDNLTVRPGMNELAPLYYPSLEPMFVMREAEAFGPRGIEGEFEARGGIVHNGLPYWIAQNPDEVKKRVSDFNEFIADCVKRWNNTHHTYEIVEVNEMNIEACVTPTGDNRINPSDTLFNQDTFEQKCAGKSSHIIENLLPGFSEPFDTTIPIDTDGEPSYEGLVEQLIASRFEPKEELVYAIGKSQFLKEVVKDLYPNQKENELFWRMLTALLKE